MTEPISTLRTLLEEHERYYDGDCGCGLVFSFYENWVDHIISLYQELPRTESSIPVVIRENYVVNVILPKLQAEINAWSRYNFGDQSYLMPLLGVYEEAGELAHAVLKSEQHIRAVSRDQDLVQDAVGDIVIYLVDFCNRYGIDFESSVGTAWELVKQRDWRLYPKNGRTE